MPLPPHYLQRILSNHPDALLQLEALYEDMDAAYDAASAGFGFHCRGCEDSCCRTRFYHHTLVEVAGLLSGYMALPEKQRKAIAARAKSYCRALHASEQHHRTLDRLCPLNVDSRCLLYRQRPMICRLHGIPHIMRHPTRGLVTGTGCHLCEASRPQLEGHPLDRTPLYTAMARLERSLRQASGIDSPVRLTIAQMVLIFEDAQPLDGKAVDVDQPY